MTLYLPSSIVEASGDSADESSGEDEVQIPIKHKTLQARHSLLDNLEEPSQKPNQDPPSKLQKRDDNLVSVHSIVNSMKLLP